MKTTTTTEQMKAITAALAALHVYPYRCESCYSKYNAQRNLSGRTHYVDDDTLRWHKSRVLSATHLCDGLLFQIVCSDALDMDNTKRGFRAVVFDVFGTTVYRPDLEHAFPSHAKAVRDAEQAEIDLVAHYREAIANEMHHREQAAKEHAKALELMPA